MNNSRFKLILLIALTLRLAFVFVGFPYLEPKWSLREDGDGYGLVAQTIREGRYTDITRGPVYPVFIAAAGSPLTVKVVQALLDTVTCAMIFVLAGRRLFAAWLWAVYPFAIWRVAFINKEIILTFLLVVYVCAQVAAMRHGKVWQWLCAGGLLGVVALCKPVFLVWPFAMIVFAWWKSFPLRSVGAMVAAMALLIAPWAYRNFIVTGGEFLPVATEFGGESAFRGNFQPAEGLSEGPGKLLWLAASSEIKERHAGASQVEIDRVFYRATWEHIQSNPLKAAELAVRKCGRFWFISAARREMVVSAMIQSVYLGLAVVGLWRLRPWTQEITLMLGVVFYLMSLHALSYADLRFSLVVMPYVCVFAGRFRRDGLPPE